MFNCVGFVLRNKSLSLLSLHDDGEEDDDGYNKKYNNSNNNDLIIMMMIIILMIVIMIIVIMMMMLLIIMVIILKGAIRDFYNLLTAPLTVSNVYAQMARAQSRITRNTSSAYHVQHVVSHVVQKDSSAILSLTELTSHLFNLYFID